jgi:predicted nucleic acid-binding protein
VVIIELKRVLLDRIKVPRGTVSNIERLLRDHNIVPRPKRHLGLGLRDPDDEWIIASASAANADVLVTVDTDILHAKGTLPVRLFTPRDLWQYLRGGEFR